MRTLIVIIFLFTLNIISANNIRITGKVLEKNTNIPLEYATISFTEIGKEVPKFGGITSEAGIFSIQVDSGIYNIKIEFIGFESIIIENQNITEDKDLGIFYLFEDAQALSEVIVKGEKRLIENKLDKKVYNISKDLTAQSTNVLQALNNVPSVAISVDGGVTLRGNSNVRILINGKPSGLVGINSTQGLERLASNSIESIEIITNPSARYDAEGASGIINIILKKGKNLGFNGSLQAIVGTPENYGFTSNINFRTKKINVFANAAINYAKRPGNQSANTTFFDETNGAVLGFLNQHQEIKRGGPEYTFALGADYYFNDKNTITFMGLYSKEDNNNNGTVAFNNFDLNNTLISTRLRTENEKEEDSSDEYTLTYKSVFDDEEEHILTIEAKYDSNTELESASFNDTITFGNLENGQDRTATSEKQHNLLLQTDYIFPFSEEGIFEAGYKSNLRTIKYNSTIEEFDINSNSWVLNTGLSNAMDYRENIHAVYLQYANNFGKFNLLTGLRAELSDINVNQFITNTIFDKNYSNLFPSFHLSYELSEESDLKASFGKRIRRPDFRELNPFPGFSNDVNLFSGNPDLNPTFTNIYEVGYSKNWDEISFDATGYFQRSTDIVQRITTNTGTLADNNIPILITTPINVGNENRYGFELSSLFRPSNWFQINTTFNLFNYDQNGNYQNLIANPNNPQEFISQIESINTSSSSWFARLSPKIKLPKNIDFQIAMQYDAPFKEANTNRRDMLVTNLSINKELFSGKGAINLNVSDLFNSRVRRQDAFNKSFQSYSENQRSQRQINLTFTYRFKKINEERGSEDEDEDD